MRGLGISIGLADPTQGQGAAIDETPAAFAFTDQTGVALSSTRTSNEIAVSGINESADVTITGGTYSKNGGGYTSAAGTALNGDTFTVRHTASASEATATNTVLTIGGVSDTFTSTTTFALVPLSLDDLTIAEDQPTGTKVGTIINATSGSTVTLHAQSNAGMFAKDGNDIEVGATPLDFETVPSPTITLRETHADASNSPNDTVVGITVTDVSEGFTSWPALIGAEMMVNGDCSSATGWGLPAGSAIAAGKLTLTALSDIVENSGITGTIIDGVTYRAVFTIDTVSLGSLRWAFGDSFGTARSTTGTFSQDIAASNSGGGASLEATSATMQLDTFSVKSVGAMGVEADWSLGGSTQISWVPDSSPPGFLYFGEAAQADVASLTGSAATAFDTAVSASTATLVSVYVPLYNAGDVSVRLRGGSWVALNISATGWSTPVAVTSGSGNGFDLRGDAGGTADLAIAAVDIDLA